MMLLSNKRCVIGEGPIWNVFDNKLYHINGYGANEICCIDLETAQSVGQGLAPDNKLKDAS